MVDLNDLSKAALSAAMRGGLDGWGALAMEDRHVRYQEPVNPKSRKMCRCGCNRRATKMGMCNGIALRVGCDFSILRWVKECKVSGRP